MDIFVEHLVKKKQKPVDVLISVGVVIGSIVLGLFAAAFLAKVFSQLSILALAGVFYLGYRFITSRNIEFEYAVTNGELDVDKIIAQRSRKRIISLKARDIEFIAPWDDANYKNEFESSQIKEVIDASSGIMTDDRYIMIFNKDGQRKKLIFEPTIKMLNVFKTYKPQNVHIKEGA